MQMNDKSCSEHPKTDYLCGECRKAYQRWHYQQNKDAYKIKHAAWYQQNKEEHKKKTRGSHRLRRYGVSAETFNHMLQEQFHSCAICSVVMGEEACVDHNHSTGQIRGLLCKSCNMALGLFWDDKEKLKNAIYYLEKYELAE